MKLIYTAVPKYLQFARDYIRNYVLQQGHAPLTPYTGAYWVLNTVDRDAVYAAQQRYIDAADEVWVFGISDSPGFESWTIDDLVVTDDIIDNIQTARTTETPILLHETEMSSLSIASLGELTNESTVEITNRSETASFLDQ